MRSNMIEFGSVLVREGLWDSLSASSERHVHMILIGTKPDIIKQAPLYLELKAQGLLTLLVHTGQHHDYRLSEGVLQEFGMQVDVNLNIGGQLYEKYAKNVERLGIVLDLLKTEYKKIPIPYVHGDTLTATTADKAAFLAKCSVVHVEAGIRTLTPRREFFHDLFQGYQQGRFDFESYHLALQDRDLYETGSIEPYPEQFDTRGIEGSTGFFAAPTHLAASFLTNEGYFPESIYITGNTVVDAIETSLKKVHLSQAYDYFPQMKGKQYLFVTIHRRENCENRERFLSIFYSLKKLLQEGVPICFLGLYASEWAIDTYGLRGELDEMMRIHPDIFAYGPALSHHHEAIDMIHHAGAVFTDSGSMQEEANYLGVKCITLRFGSDRAETFLVGCNVIAPPINSSLIVDITRGMLAKDIKIENLYGTQVSKNIVGGVVQCLQKNGTLFQYDDERLGLRGYVDYRV